MSVKKTIEHLLIEKEMTLSDLAEALGTSVQNLSNKMKRDNFTEKDIIAIAKACNCDYKISFVSNGKEI